MVHGIRMACGAALAGLVALWLAGCAAGLRSSGRADAGPSNARAEAPAPASAGGANRFEEPGELDKLLDAKPLTLAAVKTPASSAAPAGAKPSTAASTPSGKGKFRIQVGAETDFDVAQSKKREYEKILGGVVDMNFDAPYYKLRWGAFETKQEAEDKILELSDVNIQGFVVKQ